MPATFSVIMPAFRAQGTIEAAARSVLAQSLDDWELVIVSDDGTDYAGFLESRGLADRRFCFMSTGRTGAGASAARNLALDAIKSPYVAVLDADDRFRPEKLALAEKALETHGIVSCGLDVVDAGFAHLRFVGLAADGVLRPSTHKWTNLSMDSMLCWDRRVCDGRYDAVLTNMTDLELLLQLYRTCPASFHLGTPQHDYVKISGSMSNSAGITERMLKSKRTILERLETGFYRFDDPDGRDGMIAFLRLSMQAETLYPAVLAQNPGALFEDTLEPLLRAAGHMGRTEPTQDNLV